LIINLLPGVHLIGDNIHVNFLRDLVIQSYDPKNRAVIIQISYKSPLFTATAFFNNFLSSMVFNNIIFKEISNSILQANIPMLIITMNGCSFLDLDPIVFGARLFDIKMASLRFDNCDFTGMKLTLVLIEGSNGLTFSNYSITNNKFGYLVLGQNTIFT